MACKVRQILSESWRQSAIDEDNEDKACQVSPVMAALQAQELLGFSFEEAARSQDKQPMQDAKQMTGHFVPTRTNTVEVPQRLSA